MAAGMGTDRLLHEISNYCRTAGMAESTFGQRAVNDGKFVSRLRNGGRVTLTTLERVRNFNKAYFDRRSVIRYDVHTLASVLAMDFGSTTTPT
jgi:hypothetical protein